MRGNAILNEVSSQSKKKKSWLTRSSIVTLCKTQQEVFFETKKSHLPKFTGQNTILLTLPTTLGKKLNVLVSASVAIFLWKGSECPL